jgi:hypothetical protein
MRNKKQEPVPIQDLFAVYRARLRAPQGSVVKVAVVVLNEHSPVVLDESMVQYTVATRTLSVTAPSLVKHRLLLVAPLILERLEHELGAESCPRAIV